MIIQLFDKNPNAKQIQHIAECLRNGGVIIYPTDTSYGLGCSLLHPKAMQRIAFIKGKKNALNFSLLCSDLGHLSEYCKPIDNAHFRLMKQCLPGPYTFLLEANSSVPKLFNDKKKSVGIRVPDNNIIRTLIQELGHPMVNTSLEVPEEEPEYACDPELIHEKYQHVVDIVIDGGYGRVEYSSIIDCCDSPPTLIRQGKGDTSFL